MLPRAMSKAPKGDGTNLHETKPPSKVMMNWVETTEATSEVLGNKVYGA